MSIPKHIKTKYIIQISPQQWQTHRIIDMHRQNEFNEIHMYLPLFKCIFNENISKHQVYYIFKVKSTSTKLFILQLRFYQIPRGTWILCRSHRATDHPNSRFPTGRTLPFIETRLQYLQDGMFTNRISDATSRQKTSILNAFIDSSCVF